MAKTEQEINAEKAEKPRLDLFPPRALAAGSRALGYGAAKHGTPQPGGWGTWRAAGTEQAEPLTHYASLMRHLGAWRDGESFDPESGLSHLDHAMAQLAILVDLDELPPGQCVKPSEAARAFRPVDPWALPDGWVWCMTGRRGWCAEAISGSRIYEDDPVTGELGAIGALVKARNLARPDKAKATRPEGAGEPGSDEAGESRYISPTQYHIAVHDLERRTPDPIAHAVAGVSSESGELADLQKRKMVEGRTDPGPLDYFDEAGDVVFYVTLLLNHLGFSLGEAMAWNRAKLRRRREHGKDKEAEGALLRSWFEEPPEEEQPDVFGRIPATEAAQ